MNLSLYKEIYCFLFKILIVIKVSIAKNKAKIIKKLSFSIRIDRFLDCNMEDKTR